MTHLLARHAECMFWLGRYIERTASVARILMVQTEFDRGRAHSGGWAWILTLYDENDAFLSRFDGATPNNVIAYYVTDREHAGSIASSVTAARDNARSLRAMISTDLWIQIARLNDHVRKLTTDHINERRLAQTCERIQTDCYALLGIAESTFYRDSSWYFFRLGVEIERADQMSRLLDVRFAQNISGTADRGVEHGDFAFWSMLLRACGGQHAYRRLVSGPLHADRIAKFLIFDQSFGRSISYCHNQIDQGIGELRAKANLHTPSRLLICVGELNDMLHLAQHDSGLTGNLHHFNDAVQRKLSDVSVELAICYFGEDPPEGYEVASAVNPSVHTARGVTPPADVSEAVDLSSKKVGSQSQSQSTS